MTTNESVGSLDNTVTMIGAGPMGTALSEALLNQGHRLTVWNRTPEKAERLVAGGAQQAMTIAEAASASKVSIVCLADYEVMYDVLDPVGEALQGRTLVNLTSGTPKEANAAADWARARGATYLDGAIMVPPALIGHPESVLLYSGSREPFEEHRQILASMGDPRHLGMDHGLAVLYNTALLEMMYAIMNGWLHASALVGTANVSATEFADLAFGWFMPTVLSPESLAAQAHELDSATYPGHFGTLQMNLNALEHIARTSWEQGIHTDQPELMKDIAERAVAEGHGNQNYLALFEIFKKPMRKS